MRLRITLVPYPSRAGITAGGPPYSCHSIKLWLRIAIETTVPAHGYLAIRGRQRAIFRGVGYKFVEHHCYSLRRLGSHHDVGAVHRRIAGFRIRRQLMADNID